MTYPYESTIRLGEVVLNVRDLEKQTWFYSKMIGLAILKKEEKEVSLGISDQVLLRLVEIYHVRVSNYGLYHTAILVPDRPSLGAALKHLLSNGVTLTGGADHGYSEAIYLDDPEGNGIEMYRDKPMTEWDIRDDGRVIGVTEELDGTDILAVSKEMSEYQLSAGTVVGHVHLSVKDATQSSRLYQRVFGFRDKMSIPSASWIASGKYHHHLAFNQWAGSHLPKRQVGNPGLNHLTLEMEDDILFQASLKKARLYGMKVIEVSDKAYLLEDEDGIRTKVELQLS